VCLLCCLSLLSKHKAENGKRSKAHAICK
jgi:hypothetical protein